MKMIPYRKMQRAGAYNNLGVFKTQVNKLLNPSYVWNVVHARHNMLSIVVLYKA